MFIEKLHRDNTDNKFHTKDIDGQDIVIGEMFPMEIGIVQKHLRWQVLKDMNL